MTSLFEMREAPHDVVALVFPEWKDAVAEPVVAAAIEVPVREPEVVAGVSEERLRAECERVREETLAECEGRMHAALETERTALTLLCVGFARARESYFRDVENDVVRLSLSIASRVMGREAQADPVLLAGVVRVAMSRLQGAEGVVLQVPVEDQELWRKAMRSLPVAVEGAARMQRGDVRLESPAGVAELGIEAQLVEVERGFCDLLAKRPA